MLIGVTAAVENFNGAGLQQFAILLRERFRGDGFRRLLISPAGHGKVLVTAHQFNDALERIRALIVDTAAQLVQLLLLFALHIPLGQQAVFQTGVQQHLAGQAHRIVE